MSSLSYFSSFSALPEAEPYENWNSIASALRGQPLPLQNLLWQLRDELNAEALSLFVEIVESSTDAAAAYEFCVAAFGIQIGFLLQDALSRFGELQALLKGGSFDWNRLDQPIEYDFCSPDCATSASSIVNAAAAGDAHAAVVSELFKSGEDIVQSVCASLVTAARFRQLALEKGLPLGEAASQLEADLVSLLGFGKLDLIADIIKHSDAVRVSLLGVVAGSMDDVAPSQPPDLPSISNGAGLALTSGKPKSTGARRVMGKLPHKGKDQGPSLFGLTVSVPEQRSGEALRRQDVLFRNAIEQEQQKAATLLAASEQSQSSTAVSRSDNLPANVGMLGPDFLAAQHGAPKGAVSLYNCSLPPGTTRRLEGVGPSRREIVEIPPPVAYHKDDDIPRIPIKALPSWAHRAFEGVPSLNLIQSVLYPTIFGTDHNVLVMAPTGAGKTFIAILSVLHEAAVNGLPSLSAPAAAAEISSAPSVEVNDDEAQPRSTGYNASKAVLPTFRIAYVAPMKALAAEVTAGFQQRLKYLGLKVAEVTGDTDIPRSELESLHIMVTTPEKLDILTRKPSYTSIVDSLSLIIFDEVHLLHEDRGSVIETLAARLISLSEAKQRRLRIVALSATLPNFLDVALFLCVTPSKGLFVFPPQFRPVPLRTKFIGVQKPPKTKGSSSGADPGDDAAFDVAVDAAVRGHGVLVFVHSRRATVSLIAKFQEKMPSPNPFLPVDHCGASVETIYGTKKMTDDGYTLLQRSAKQIQNASVKELRTSIYNGMACHHAGMPRSDRNLVEKLFHGGAIRLLFCTATLAWGVNLPAKSVIIRGTDVFKSEGGGASDLSILDVLQIFGRAGRPQFDTEGEATLITNEAKLTTYLRMYDTQSPIESRLLQQLPDHLNAEVVLSNISSISDGIRWLGHTFWYIRACADPRMALGATGLAAARQDPNLVQLREKVIRDTATTLDAARLIRYDRASGSITATELGRIAAYHYVSFNTMKTWTRDEVLLRAFDIERTLQLVSLSQEFSRLAPRDDEIAELEQLVSEVCPYTVRGDDPGSSGAGKANVLLQAWIQVGPNGLKTHSLVCDMLYVAKQAPRLLRALYELAIYRGMASRAITFHSLCLAAEKRVWGTSHPLRQFGQQVPTYIADRLESKRVSIDFLREASNAEIGDIVNHKGIAATLRVLAQSLPAFDVEINIQPITCTVLRMQVNLRPVFTWPKDGPIVEPLCIIVGDTETDRIYHTETLMLERKTVVTNSIPPLNFTIGLLQIASDENDGAEVPSHYTVTVVAERWQGVKSKASYPTMKLRLPQTAPKVTELMKLAPLPTSVLPGNLSVIFPHPLFNPIQTQVFFTLFHTNVNVLIGAPTGSGKTVVAELALLRLLHESSRLKAVYVAPLKALVRERVLDWIPKFKKLGISVVELTGDSSPQAAEVKAARIIITVPEKWDGISRVCRDKGIVKDVGLLLFDEVHVLGSDRGCILEAIVSRMRSISWETGQSLRTVSMSTSVANAEDLASWLDVPPEGLFNFKPQIRPVPMTVHIRAFPGKHYCPRMNSMNKAVFNNILQHSPDVPTLVFVSSRRQTRLTALALRDLLVGADRAHSWHDDRAQEAANMPASSREYIQDDVLRDVLSFGLAIHHAGMCQSDKSTVEKLFASGAIRVLVATTTLAWGVNLPAHLVILKGTEYFDGSTCQYVDYPVTDVLQMMGRAGRPQFDTHAVACVFVEESKKTFYKKFLYQPFPVESYLHLHLASHLNAEIAGGKVTNRGQAAEYLTWTYLFRRLAKNPSYYGVNISQKDAANSTIAPVMGYIRILVDDTLASLQSLGCIVPITDDDGNQTWEPTTPGLLAAQYYVSPVSADLFRTQGGHSLSFQDALTLLSCSSEFDEVPVRHNEDLVNEQFYKSIMASRSKAAFSSELFGVVIDEIGAKSSLGGIARLAFGDSHTKARLLLLAHLAHVDMPMVDYITDLRSVLENASRVLQCMTDIICDGGNLKAALACILLAECLNVGHLPADPPLLQVAGFTSDVVSRIEGKCLGQTLRALVKDRDAVLSKVKAVPALRSRVGALERALGALPYVSLRGWIDHAVDVDPDTNESYPVLRFSLFLMAPLSSSLLSGAYCASKARRAPGFFVLIGDVGTNELLAVARVSVRSHHSTAKEKLSACETNGDNTGRTVLDSELNAAIAPQDAVTVDTSKGGATAACAPIGYCELEVPWAPEYSSASHSFHVFVRSEWFVGLGFELAVVVPPPQTS